MLHIKCEQFSLQLLVDIKLIFAFRSRFFLHNLQYHLKEQPLS